MHRPALKLSQTGRVLASIAALLLAPACSTEAPEVVTGIPKPSESTVPAACGDAATLISAIQGSGPVSPLSGTRVVVEAIVVGDYQETSTSNPDRPELSGFYLQEEDADTDDDPATSEGLFVYDPAKTLELVEGDKVRVAGRISEFAGNTQLDDLDSVLRCGSGYPVTPHRLELPVPSRSATLDSFYEPLEGMLVRLSDVMTVSDHFELARYGQLLLTQGGNLRQYSQDAELSLNQAHYLAWQEAEARRSIKLDDFNLLQNIDPVYFPQPGNFSVDNPIRIGAEIRELTGVINTTGGEWVVQASKTRTPAIVNPERPVSPPAVAGDTRIAVLNVLNYFNGDGLGGGFPTRRGADSLVELQRQTAKIVATITRLDADVLGLLEIENDGDGANDALAYLVDAINALAGPGTYAAVQAGTNGGSDEIKVALIYKPSALERVGAAKVLADAAFSDPNNSGSQQSRPALAQTFRVLEQGKPDTGAAFTMVVLHLKSKGSPCGAGDDDAVQGNCNGTRSKGAKALLDWLATDPTATTSTLGKLETKLFIVGDLNAYHQEDPLQIFFQAGFSSAAPASAHTFVYGGRRGTLDYILLSPALASQGVQGGVWNINSDESSLLDYNDTVQDTREADYEAKPSAHLLYANDVWRSSDHDPVIAGLNLLDAPAGAVTATGTDQTINE